MSDLPVQDVLEIQQLLAEYAVAMTQFDVDRVVKVFTPDGTYSAFGDAYQLADFPALVAAAPKGLFLVGPPVLKISGDTATGEQPLLFMDQTTHDERIGWYTDAYLRTADGWRLKTRRMTFLRRSGTADSGIAHDPRRPTPSAVVDSGFDTARPSPAQPPVVEQRSEATRVETTGD